MNQRAINALTLFGAMQAADDGARLAQVLANLRPDERRELERVCDEGGTAAGIERLRNMRIVE